MRFPRFWQRQSRDGLAAWGWSDVSREEARGRATERLARIVAALRAGRQPERYAYEADPIRERVIERFGEADSPYAVVTRNGYGALILNTRRVGFVDIDLEDTGGEGPLGFLARLFGGGSKNSLSASEEARKRIEEQVDRSGGPSMRIYETRAGLRLLLTDGTHEPDSGKTQSLLKSFGCDPLYANLCVRQRCFRARLTAKPWRIDLPRPPIRFPEEDSPASYSSWCDRYDRAASRFAACRHVGTLGAQPVDEEVRQVVAIHDERSGVSRSAELA